MYYFWSNQMKSNQHNPALKEQKPEHIAAIYLQASSLTCCTHTYFIFRASPVIPCVVLNIRTVWIVGKSHRRSAAGVQKVSMKGWKSLVEPCSTLWFHSGTVLNRLTLMCQCVMVDTGTTPDWYKHTHTSEKLFKIWGNIPTVRGILQHAGRSISSSLLSKSIQSVFSYMEYMFQVLTTLRGCTLS